MAASFFIRGAAVLAASGLAAACASGPQGPEPRLTNPTRYSQWLGEGAEMDTSRQDPNSQALQKYDQQPFLLPLTEDWAFQMPDPGAWQISRLELGRPSIGVDRIFVGSSRSAGVHVLNRTTGREIARIDTSGPVQAEPLAHEGHWFLADTFGQVQRLDDQGTPIWKEPYQAGSAIYRQPVLAGDSLYLSTEADTVVALNAETGAWKWSHRRDVPRGAQDLAILGSPSPAMLDDGVLAVGFSDGWILGLDPNAGAELWAVQVGTGQFRDIQAQVMETNGLLIAAGFGGPVLALDATTRELRWVQDEIGSISNLWTVRDRLYLSGPKGQLWCLDRDSGEPHFSWAPKKPTQLGPPVRVGGSILVGDVNGTLYAIDRFEGTLQWKYRPADGTRLAGVASAPAVRGRQVVFPTAGGRVLSLVSETSLEADQIESPGKRPDRVLSW